MAGRETGRWPREGGLRAAAPLINGFPVKGRGVMGTCSYCGSPFPRTRKTRKYCTSRCKTNACLDKKPRLRASELEALRQVLASEFPSVEAMRERLRAILAPQLPAIPLDAGRPPVPRLD